MKSVTRRRFLQSTAGIVSTAAWQPATQKAFGMPAVLSSGSYPNLILILADTLRPDHLGCYGSTLAASPAIDAFAWDASGSATPDPNRCPPYPFAGRSIRGDGPSRSGTGFHNGPIRCESTTGSGYPKTSPPCLKSFSPAIITPV